MFFSNSALTFGQRESTDNCHISHQVQHDPMLLMVEAYAYSAAPIVTWSCPFVSLDEVLIRWENLSKYVFSSRVRVQCTYSQTWDKGNEKKSNNCKKLQVFWFIHKFCL